VEAAGRPWGVHLRRVPLDNTVAGPVWVWLFGLFVLFCYGVWGGGWLGVERKGNLFS
jgi:hypothetical protein